MTSSLTANAVVVWLRCTFLLLYTQSQFFWHQCTLRSPAFFWWFRPRLAYWTYMSMISNYICYGPYYKCNLLLIAYTQTIPDSKSKSKSLNPRTYIKSDPRKLCSQVIFLNSRQFQFHVHSPYNNMYVPKLNCRFIYALYVNLLKIISSIVLNFAGHNTWNGPQFFPAVYYLSFEAFL